VPEPARIVDRGQKRDCGDRADAGHGHEAPQGLVATDQTTDVTIEGSHLQHDMAAELGKFGHQCFYHRKPLRQCLGLADQGVGVARADNQAERLKTTPPLSFRTQTLTSLSDTSFSRPRSCASNSVRIVTK